MNQSTQVPKLILPTASIETIDVGNLNAWINHLEQPRLIEFYASWCIYHMLTRKNLERLAEVFGKDFVVGSIDCLGNEGIFRSHGIWQIPAIGFYYKSFQKIWFGYADLDLMISEIRQALQTQT